MTASYAEAKRRGASRCGVGLGLRWDFLDQALQTSDLDVAFWEISPENYMGRGGYFPQALERLKEEYAFVCHGLSMSVGAEAKPDPKYLAGLDQEITRVGSPWHSDHLCLSTAGPLVLHELLPLPLTRAYARKAADRIRSIEDELRVPFAIENISYYAEPAPGDLNEVDFICEVLRLADCGLLLDVNNVYVNARNHGYDAEKFIRQLPIEQVVQLHIAGHVRLEEPHPAEGLLLDTHGAPASEEVLDLLKTTLDLVGPVPVVLERDNEVPELEVLLTEVKVLQEIYEGAVGGED